MGQNQQTERSNNSEEINEMEAKNTIQKLMNQKFHEMINKTDKPLARPRNKIQINEIRNGK